MMFRLFTILALLFHNALFAEAQGLCQTTNIPAGAKEGQFGRGFSVGGRDAKSKEFPWHAGIYSKLFQPFMQICGGSLVSTSVVISAAHCFMNGQRQNFAVAVGKLYRPWNDEMDKNAQKSDISQIHIPPRYHGSLTNFQDDLAVLIMTTPFVFNDDVQPINLDFDNSLDKKHLVHGNVGMVPGWGRTDANGKASPTLQVVKLPSVDVQRCFDEIEPVFRPAITSDKICAGNNTAGTAVCMGDSGGGLAFSEGMDDNDRRFYLRGVVSTAPNSVNNDLCNVYTYATFTHIIKHEHFIRDILAASPQVNQRSSTLDQSESRPQTKPANPEERNTVNAQPLAFTGVQTDLTTEKRPFLSQNKPTQSSENQIANSIGAQPLQCVENQPAQTNGVQLANSIKNELAQAIGIHPAQSTEIRPHRIDYHQHGYVQYPHPNGNPHDYQYKHHYQYKLSHPYQHKHQHQPGYQYQSGNVSTENNPNQYSGNRSAQKAFSIENQPGQTIRVPPAYSIENQPGQTIRVSPAYSIENEPGQTIRVPPAYSIENKPGQTIRVPPAYSIENQPGQTIRVPPAYSIENQPGLAIRVPPAYSIENQPGQTIGARPGQNIDFQPWLGSSGIQSRQFDYHQHGYDQYHSNRNPHDYQYNNHHQLQYGHQNQHENQYQPGYHHQHGHNTHGQGYNYQSPQKSKLPGQW